MNVDILASSSAGNAIALREGGSTLLLEAGMRFPELRRALDHQVSSLDACLVTHEHQDHARSVAHVMAAGVDTYASEGTWDALPAEYRCHRSKVVRAGSFVQIGDWKVMPFEAIHDAAEPLCYLIARGGHRVLYVTDSAYCPYRFKGLTHILLEANFSMEILRENVETGTIPRAHMHRVLGSHMSIERAIQLLKANDLRQVQEIHLLHLSDGNSDEADFVNRVQRATGKPVYAAPARRVEGVV